MPTYLTNWPLWRDLIPIPVMAAIVTIALVRLVAARKQDTDVPLPVVYAMTLLGITTGLLAGQSREPVIGAVLPAVLALVGGVSVYLFATKGTGQQTVVALSMIGFALCLLVGTFWGTRLRSDFEDHQASEEHRLAVEIVEQNVRVQRLFHDKQLQDLRERLKLSGASEGRPK